MNIELNEAKVHFINAYLNQYFKTINPIESIRANKDVDSADFYMVSIILIETLTNCFHSFSYNKHNQFRHQQQLNQEACMHHSDFLAFSIFRIRRQLPSYKLSLQPWFSTSALYHVYWFSVSYLWFRSIDKHISYQLCTKTQQWKPYHAGFQQISWSYQYSWLLLELEVVYHQHFLAGTYW